MNTFLNKETKIRLFYFIAAHFWQKKIFFQKTAVISKKVRKIAHFFVEREKKMHSVYNNPQEVQLLITNLTNN